jgi:hypothetical protein
LIASLRLSEFFFPGAKRIATGNLKHLIARVSRTNQRNLNAESMANAVSAFG